MDLANTIRAAAQQYGLDPDAMVRIAQVESGLNPNAANPKSSARGLYQFIDSTWQRYGRGASPLDPNANIDAGMRFAVDNRNTLRSALGRDPTPGELYLAHQQGAGGALQMLKNPNAPVGGDAIALNGGTPGMTAGQFASKWTSKFDGTAAPAAGQPATAAPAQTAAPQMMLAAAEPGIDLSPLAETLQRAAMQTDSGLARRRPRRDLGPVLS